MMYCEDCLTRVVILLQVQQLSTLLTERDDELLLLKQSVAAAADQQERIREASQHWREVKCENFTITSLCKPCLFICPGSSRPISVV